MNRMAGGEKVFEQRIKCDIGCHQLGLHRHLASQVNVSVERELGVGELGTCYQFKIGPIGNAEDIEIADALSIHHQVMQAERGVDYGGLSRARALCFKSKRSLDVQPTGLQLAQARELKVCPVQQKAEPSSEKSYSPPPVTSPQSLAATRFWSLKLLPSNFKSALAERSGWS